MTTWKLTGSVIRHDYEIKPGVTASEAIAFMAEEDDIANARLIAAAPQLLEACKVAYDWFIAKYGSVSSPEGTIIAELYKAIAAAEVTP